MPAFDLAQLGWDSEMAATFVAVAGSDDAAGRVARVDTGVVTVLTSAGIVRASWGARLLAAAAEDPTAAPSTGDWVALRHWPDDRTTVEVVLPRRTILRRAASSGRSETQVLATNVDAVLNVVSLAVDPDLGRVERLIALAWESGAQPVVVLTKADLVADAELVAQDVSGVAPGVPVHIVSAATGKGMAAMDAYASTGETVVLVGPSGVGKSTLANALIGADMLRTGPIRADGRGRHVTAARELIPLRAGGVLIDTPGIRGVGLLDVNDGLHLTFPDIEALAVHCRFADCMHIAEPGCAVLAAVDAAILPARRLESWRKLRREAQHMAARTDARLRAEELRRWKAVSSKKSMRKAGVTRP
jgi:ribosome biogenesis GTPase / thiamine phosphate phosphatase